MTGLGPVTHDLAWAGNARHGWPAMTRLVRWPGRPAPALCDRTIKATAPPMSGNQTALPPAGSETEDGPRTATTTSIPRPPLAWLLGTRGSEPSCPAQKTRTGLTTRDGFAAWLIRPYSANHNCLCRSGHTVSKMPCCDAEAGCGDVSLRSLVLPRSGCSSPSLRGI